MYYSLFWTNLCWNSVFQILTRLWLNKIIFLVWFPFWTWFMFKAIFSFGTRFLSCTRWNLFSILNSLEIVFYLEFIPALNSILVWNRFSHLGHMFDIIWLASCLAWILDREWLLDYELLVDHELLLDHGLLIWKWKFGKVWNILILAWLDATKLRALDTIGPQFLGWGTTGRHRA